MSRAVKGSAAPAESSDNTALAVYNPTGKKVPMRNPWCVAVALLLVASTVAAETVLEREGELASGDPVLEDGRPVDWLRVSLASGTRYLFRVASDEIDTSLILRFADGATLANDDFDGSDPALLYSALRAETVEVGVTTSSASEGGPYTLTVQTLAAARSVQTGLKGSRTLGPESAVDIGDGERWFADSVLLTGARGDRVTVRLGSSDFDAYLRVQSRDGYAEENDDARNTTDAQIRYVFAQRGQIEVIVRSTSPSEGGEYALSIEREGTAASIDLGRPVSGRIAEGSVQYLLEGKKGQAAIVSLRSETFDPLLEIVDRAGRKSANDDYGDGTDSQLHYLFPEDGTVTVSVTRQDSGEAGSFRLSAEPVSFRANDFALSGRELTGDTTIEGYLAAGNLRRDQRYAHRYTFAAEAYELVRIEMTSESFDAYLELTGPEGFEASDDDSLGGYDARLETACPTAGEYSVFASSSSDWGTGFYELTFGRGGVVEPLIDQTARLELRDERDLSGRHFDTYAVEVEEGGSLVVDMSSADLDAYLFLWDPRGEEIYQDDDGGGDTNARLSVSGAVGGTWTIYATSADHSETGAYRLRVLAY